MVTALLLVVLAAGCCAPAGAVAYLTKLPVDLAVTATPTAGQGTFIIVYAAGLSAACERLLSIFLRDYFVCYTRHGLAYMAMYAEIN